jgi:hypothetical protein
MSSHRLQTEIEIAAEPERVWSILTDFAVYPEWNPFIRYISGVPQPGARLEVLMQPGGTRGMSFRPSVLIADAGRELRWLGHLMFPGLFDGEHRFVIEPISAGKVRFQQCERFSGILVPLLRRRLDQETKRGFEEMNLALKARAEA